MSSKAKSKPSQRSPAQQASLFILQYKSRRVLVGSPTDYDQLQLSIRRHFPDIPIGHRVSYHTNELAISKGALVEVSEDIWDTAIPLLNTLTVQNEPTATICGKRTVEKTGQECDSSCDENDGPKPPVKKPRRDAGLSFEPPQAPAPSRAKHATLTLNVAHIDGKSFELRCTASTTLNRVLSAAVEKLGLDKALPFRVIYEGQDIGSSDHDTWLFGDSRSPTIHELGIKDGGHIVLVPRLVGGKPVIYLFPPSGAEIDASVRLSLVPEWHFSAIYPVVLIASCTPESGSVSAGQTLQWDVKASSDGTLLEKNTGLNVAYLYWEAEAFSLPAKNLSSPSSALAVPSSLIAHNGELVEARFIPNQPRIEPSNSVALEVAKLTPYLDSMLKALGLHVEARTSFITYWLPSFLKHTHIALRFLPQSAYERAAPLEVEPKPDVVVRVFMLFKGLKHDEVQNEVGDWCEATEADAARWISIVGVDESRSLADGSLFRVVEWGGMEVLA